MKFGNNDPNTSRRLITSNSVQVYTGKYKMFRCIIFMGHGVEILYNFCGNLIKRCSLRNSVVD